MDILARWLADTGISQTDFARELEVSQPTVSDWLRGEKLPSTDNLRRIAQRTGISADKLLGITVTH